MPKDKFLQEQIKLEDGWIPLEVMLKFKRLSSLTTDCDVIVAALEASDLVEVRIHFVISKHLSDLNKSYWNNALYICVCLVVGRREQF